MIKEQGTTAQTRVIRSEKRWVLPFILSQGCSLGGLVFGFVGFGSGALKAELPSKIDFNQHIRPLLSDACFKCHGTDEKQRKGKLRLDVREDALAKKAIVLGKPDESELIKRILTTDDEDVMPPSKEHRVLKADEKELLRRWIAEGAPYKNHWAFITVVKPPVPAVGGAGPEINPVDAFVLAKLAEQKMQPAAPASKEQWLRRVTFALTGLPPSLKEIDVFVADGSPKARDAVVDRLLTSDACAEHLAKDWLDAARYADSYGRHEDGDMLAWPWRDWVIKAFKDNLPYDQFVTWQTAGDLLPNPTRDQMVATAFNRLALQSNESGSDPEEFRLDQVSDRVRANGMAFMGLTMECAKCHDHKYDPISQREYWQMSALFDNIDENGVYSQFCPKATPSPSILLPTPDQQTKLDAINKQIADKEEQLKTVRNSAQNDFKSWIADNGIPGAPESGVWNTVKSWFGAAPTLNPWDPHAKAHTDFEKQSATEKSAKEFKNLSDPGKPIKIRTKLESIPGPVGNAVLMKGDDEVSIPKMGDFHEFDDFSFAVWLQPREHRDRAVVVCSSRGGNDDGRGYEVILQDEVPSFALMHFYPANEIRIKAKKPLPMNEWTHVAVTYNGSSRADGLKMYLNGSLIETDVVHDNLQQDMSRRAEWGDKYMDQVRFTLGGREHDSPLKNCGVDEYWVFGRAISPGEVKTLVGVPASADDWYDWWLMKSHKAWRQANAELEKLREQRTSVTNDVLDMMVMKDQPLPRKCFVRTRGDYRQRGVEVEPGALNAVLAFGDKYPKNRLGFAQWLVSREHPLTSRVAVNRIWQLLFGKGLTATPQDFGVRGEIPANPELLDWLAADFMDNGWNVRRLCRLIVLSSTFGQSTSPSDPQSLTSDPENRWLARGSSARLTAEELRDQALAISGLLINKVGGPSARPYMPVGLYRDSGLQQSYEDDAGEGLYRRSLYSFWRRTLPPPELTAFDAPSREFCVVKREKTSTPLQALVLLNATQFVEAQRVFAEKLVKQFPTDDKARCEQAFRTLTGRKPAEAESTVLSGLMQQHRTHFQAHADEAKALMQNGTHPPDGSLPAHEVAATAMVLRTLMSHVEAMNR